MTYVKNAAVTITQISFQLSTELEKEISFFSGSSEGQKIFDQFKTTADLIRHVEESFEYRDITRIPQLFKPGRVLDVGVAYGLTSAYLSLKGFDVTCVEPTLKLCEDMEKNFDRLGIKAHIVCATGEALDQVKGTFDLVVFFSSLHHCDDPAKALVNSYDRLEVGGILFIFEPVLKFYRSKSWFFRQMEEHPEKVGHYGGNEHIYRFGEYVAFLKKAGFEKIRAIPSINYGLVPKKAPWDNSLRYLVKRIYFFLVRQILIKRAILRVPLEKLSLINPVIIGEKLR